MSTIQNLPVLFSGTTFVEQVQQQVVQQGELALRDGIINMDMLITQENTEVQQFLPADNRPVEEWKERQLKRGRAKAKRRREEEQETVEEDERGYPSPDDKGKIIDLKA